MKFVKQSLVAASVITVGANVLSRFLGYIREALIANYFGTSEILDTFIVAFTIPEIMGMILFVSSSAALIPQLAKHLKDSENSHTTLFYTGLYTYLILFLTISVLLFLFREQLISELNPGMTGNIRNLSIHIFGILSWFVLFRGIEAYCIAWLYFKKHFIIPSISYIILNIILIGFLVTLYDKYNILALAYAWFIGSFVLCLIALVYSIRIVSSGFSISYNRSFAASLLYNFLIINAIESISIIYPLIDRMFAVRHLGPGPISALKYATAIFQVPAGILSAGFNVAAFPWIAELSAEKNNAGLASLYKESLYLIIFVTGVIVSGVLLFSEDITRVALQRGAFDSTSLALTSTPLFIYMIGLVSFSIFTFQMRFYYGQRKLFRLGMILIILLLVKYFGCVFLIRDFGHAGLAASTSITWILGSILITIDMRSVFNLPFKELFNASLGKMIFNIAFVSTAWILLKYLWPTTPESTLTFGFFRLTVFAVAGIGIYLLLAYILKLPEYLRLLDIFKSKLRVFGGRT